MLLFAEILTLDVGPATQADPTGLILLALQSHKIDQLYRPLLRGTELVFCSVQPVYSSLKKKKNQAVGLGVIRSVPESGIRKAKVSGGSQRIREVASPGRTPEKSLAARGTKAENGSKTGKSQ